MDRKVTLAVVIIAILTAALFWGGGAKLTLGGPYISSSAPTSSSSTTDNATIDSRIQQKVEGGTFNFYGASYSTVRTDNPQAIKLYEATSDGNSQATITVGAKGTGLSDNATISIEGAEVDFGALNLATTGSIQLGHASDTTVSRSAAGVVSVEGLKLPRIVASGTITNDHPSLADGNCTVALDGGTATGTATTDLVLCNFSGDPTAITGFAATGGGLFIYCYPSSDHVNVKICNKTGGAVDAGSFTLNWMVLR